MVKQITNANRVPTDGVTKRSNAVTSNEKTSNGIKIQELKKIKKLILMKEKHKSGCNILIMTFTNLEKYLFPKSA